MQCWRRCRHAACWSDRGSGQRPTPRQRALLRSCAYGSMLVTHLLKEAEPRNVDVRHLLRASGSALHRRACTTTWTWIPKAVLPIVCRSRAWACAGRVRGRVYTPYREPVHCALPPTTHGVHPASPRLKPASCAWSRCEGWGQQRGGQRQMLCCTPTLCLRANEADRCSAHICSAH